MKFNSLIKLLAVNLYLSALLNPALSQTYQYPPTPKHPMTDTIFGRQVVDEYRWLEDLNNQQVRGWLRLQADYTTHLIDQIPGRNTLIEEYKSLDKVTKEDIPYTPRRGGSRYFYMKILPNEALPRLYYREGKTGKEALLFNPIEYWKGETANAAYRFFPSKDGKKVALRLTEKGNFDVATIKVVDVDSKLVHVDSLFPVASVEGWTPDGKGIIYGLLQTSDPLSTSLFQDMKIKYHELGSDVKEDKTLLSRTNNPSLGIKAAELLSLTYSPDLKYVIATLWSGAQDKNRSFFAHAIDVKNDSINWKPLARTEDQVREAIIVGKYIFLLTRKNAPNFKVLVSEVERFDINKAQTLVHESILPIEGIQASRDFLFIKKTDGINTLLDKYSLLTKRLEAIKLPFSGTAGIGVYDGTTNDCVIEMSSWIRPISRYDYNPYDERVILSAFNVPKNYPGTTNLLVEETEVRSHDGTMVPLSLIYTKGLKRNGKNVVLMTGYGAYGISALPYFNLLHLPLLNKGVIIAISHPRGGGEKGYAWHMGGFKANKPNTWKDFIACGEHLINNGYTSPKHLVGDGVSAGGILIGRAVTERPDLFAAVINNVPVSNPLRGEHRPNGKLDAQEFGTIKDSVEALGLIEMDAYLHIKKGVKYPAVLAIGGMNDTRVPIWQPAKLIAALQEATASDKPILLKVNYNGGHGSDEKSAVYKNLADQFAFALWQAGHKGFQPVPK